MKTIFNFITWLILPKKIRYQGLILKKKFCIYEDYTCINCYFDGRNRSCPEDKSGSFICSNNTYFVRIKENKKAGKDE